MSVVDLMQMSASEVDLNAEAFRQRIATREARVGIDLLGGF